MKIKYTKDATFVSQGISFEKGIEMEVSAELGKYLLSTFSGMFEEIAPVVVKKDVPKKVSKKSAE